MDLAVPRQPDAVIDPDDALVLRAGRGDRTAAAALMARHLPKMLALARRVLISRSESEAEDAVQDAFLKLWLQAPRWQPGRAKIETWLYRVVLNQCYDRLRRRQYAPLDTVMNAPDPAPLPTAGIEAVQTAAKVNTAMEALPRRQRTAVTLCHLQEMGNIEAAEVMGISVEALESLLSRGRRALREMLKGWKEG